MFFNHCVSHKIIFLLYHLYHMAKTLLITTAYTGTGYIFTYNKPVPTYTRERHIFSAWGNSK